MTLDRTAYLEEERTRIILERNRLQEQVDDLETRLHAVEAELGVGRPRPPEDEL